MTTPAGIDRRILIVDDDVQLVAKLKTALQEHRFEVHTAHDVQGGRALMAAAEFDLCLIDIVMPGASGRVFCREVAETSTAAVIMMSSLSDSETIIALLESGADDYVVKPFKTSELGARIRAVLRRVTTQTARVSKTPEIGPWTFEIELRRLKHSSGFNVKLTPSEAEVLRLLAGSPGLTFTREDLLAISRARQHGGIEDRAIDNLMKRLRKKIEKDTSVPRHIITVRGVGYRLEL